MKKTTTSLFIVQSALLLFVGGPVARADTGVDCQSGWQSAITINIQYNSSTQTYQASPNAACVTHNATITWSAGSGIKFVVFFLSDATSPFQANDRWHDENNPNDMVTVSSTNCPQGSSTCTFRYMGVVIDSSGAHLIDPKVVVNPNALGHPQARKKSN